MILDPFIFSNPHFMDALISIFVGLILLTLLILPVVLIEEGYSLTELFYQAGLFT